MKHQRENIKRLFESRPFQWIPCYEIAKLALQYNSRVLDLRRLGMTIQNKTKHVDGEVHSWFRFLPKDASGQERFA